MMSLKNIPIRRKLMLIILLTSVVVMLLMRLSFFTYEFLTFRQTTLRHLSALGEVIAINSTAALAFDNRGDATETLSALRIEPHIVAACLYDKDGALFAKFPANLPDDIFPTSLGTAGYHYQRLSLTGFQPVVQSDKRLGTLYLKLDTSAIMHDWLVGSISIAGMVMAVILLMTYFVSRSLQKQISAPILALTDTARAISDRHDFSVRATKLSGDELGVLTDAFNQMLDRIHELNNTLEQRVRERTGQLEAVNRELEAFSYSVSHDLRAPLRHIDGFADMLRRESADKLTDSGRRYLETISGSAKRMGTLIDDLLVFSRMGRAEMRHTRVNTNSVIADVIQEMAPDIQGRNIVWDIGTLPEVQGDYSMLKQVWVNLLSNAAKYSRQKERAEIHIHAEKKKREWQFTIRDNGAGFDMRYADKLFGVFQRLHHAEEFEGTGIGLANVRRIVLRHGGRIWAESQIGAGATFHFTLPEIAKEKA